MAQETTDEGQKREYDPREHLRQLRDECIDEIPPEIIHSHTRDKSKPPYKVQKGWFSGVKWDLHNMLKRGRITDPDLQSLARQAIKRFSTPPFRGETPTTREDIDYANEIITKILGE